MCAPARRGALSTQSTPQSDGADTANPKYASCARRRRRRARAHPLTHLTPGPRARPEQTDLLRTKGARPSNGAPTSQTSEATTACPEGEKKGEEDDWERGKGRLTRGGEAKGVD